MEDELKAAAAAEQTSPGRLLPFPLAGVTYWSEKGLPLLEAFKGKLVSDGSCSTNDIPELKRAGWAIGALENGRLVATLKGPVWASLPQCSPVAEATALLALASCVRAKASLWADYTGVLIKQKIRAKLLSAKTKMAGIWRQVLASKGWEFVQDINWVESHQNEEDIVDPDELEIVQGNNLIDLEAKDAASRHPKAPKQCHDDVELCYRLAKATCALAANLLPLFPARERGERVPGQRGPKTKKLKVVLPVEDRHDWSWLGGHWRCAKCLMLSRNRTNKAAHPSVRCQGFSSNLRLAVTMQHQAAS